MDSERLSDLTERVAIRHMAEALYMRGDTPEDCRKMGVGLVRRQLTTEIANMEAKVVDGGARKVVLGHFIGFCRTCRRCALGRE